MIKLCLVYIKRVAVPKKYNLYWHYKSPHKEKYVDLEEKLHQQQLFTSGNKVSEAAVQTSISLSWIIAKESKPLYSILVEFKYLYL